MVNTELPSATQEREPRVVRDSGRQKKKPTKHPAPPSGRVPRGDQGRLLALPKPAAGAAVGRVTGGDGWRGPQQHDGWNNRASEERLRRPHCGGEEEEGKALPHRREGDVGGVRARPWPNPTTWDPGARPESGKWAWGEVWEDTHPPGRRGYRPGGPARAACPGGPAPGGLIRRAPRHSPGATHARSRSPRSRNAEPRRRRSRSGSMAGGWRQTAAAPPPPPWPCPAAGGGSGTAPPRPSGLRVENRGAEVRPHGSAGRLAAPRRPCCVPAGAGEIPGLRAGGGGASCFPTSWKKGWLPRRPPRERHRFVPCCPPELRHSCSLVNFTTKKEGNTKDAKHTCHDWHELPNKITHGIVLLPYRQCSSRFFCLLFFPRGPWRRLRCISSSLESLQLQFYPP